MEIIFLDESNFHLENNHLKVRRRKNEYQFFNASIKGWKNIIIAVTDNKILLYELKDGANKFRNILEFMKKLVDTKDENLHNYMLVMDNCSIQLNYFIFMIWNNRFDFIIFYCL